MTLGDWVPVDGIAQPSEVRLANNWSVGYFKESAINTQRGDQ